MQSIDIDTDGKNIVWQSLIDGVGVLMMEDISPGSADVREMISSSIVLTRAVQEPHRKSILEELLLIFPSRKDEITAIIKKIKPENISSLAMYDICAALAWGSIKAKVEKGQSFMINVIAKGWDIVIREPIDEHSARFCLFLMSAVDSPLKLKTRDEWAFSAFEPIATVGSKMAIELGIILED